MMKLKHGVDQELEDQTMEILMADRKVQLGEHYGCVEETRYWPSLHQEEMRSDRNILTAEPQPELFHGLYKRAYNPIARTPVLLGKMRNNGTDRQQSPAVMFFNRSREGRSVWEDTDLFEWTQRD